MDNFSCRLRLTLEVFQVFQFGIRRIADWLKVLEIDIPPPIIFSSINLDQQYCMLGAAFIREMLLASRIPNFVAPEIVSIELIAGSEGKIRVIYEVNVPDGLPILLYKTIFKICFENINLMSNIECNIKNQEYLFGKLNEELVKPLRRVIPTGQSTMHLLRAAHEKGIPFVHFGLGIFQLGWGSRARLVDRSTTERDSAIGAKLSHDKAKTAGVLKVAGLPYPKHVVISSEKELAETVKLIGFPLVVKPNDQECGIGVSVDLYEVKALYAAFSFAKQKSASGLVIVEKQVPGVCHRIFIAHGKLLYAVKRDPIKILGDGVKTIAEIISLAENAQLARPPWLREPSPTLDEHVIRFIASIGYRPESVPELGISIPLRRIESTVWGGCDEDVTQKIHPDNLSIALRAAEIFKLSVAGVDFISVDISVPWHKNGAVINELNFAPLLGGAEISRSYIPQYLSALIDGNGKIPIEACENRAEWLSRHKYWQAREQRCFTVASKGVIDDRFESVMMSSCTFRDRMCALLLRPDVDVILICFDPDLAL